MKIDDLMDKERRIQYQILLTLYRSKGSLPLKQVMQSTAISKVTLLKYLEHLVDLLQEHAIPCSLSWTTDEIILEESSNFMWEDLISVFIRDSLSYQILLYLSKHEHFAITALSQELMVSEATLNRQLVVLNNYLEEFQLSISQGRQVGHELQWRYFYYQLFCLTLTESEKQMMFEEENQHHLVKLVERLLGKELDVPNLQKLSLWFAISQNRFSFHNEKTLFEHIDHNTMEQNGFYKRLNQLLLHYFSRFALEFDGFESKSLFAFLVTNPILPRSSMSYILGFGGPISDKISEALWLMKKAEVLTVRTKEDIIYGLGLFFSRAYFFKGIILDGHQELTSLQHLIPKEEKTRIDLVVQHLMMQLEDRSLYQSDFAQFLNYHLLQLLIFSLERHHKPLRVALALGPDSVEKAIAELTIRKYLKNNRHFHFEPYRAEIPYDCIVSCQRQELRTCLPSFHLKHFSSSYELQALEGFLKKVLEEKIALEDTMEQD
ncbi:trans-acting positive regulator [Streptococcus iniae]|uniref:helix-turn-helix domain-containing protein n=1 Tax=Streptococcus iniae TaxID=1346 RepID=UPI000B606205|nr:helix-turn-helix domain-containing protein [Streptococcus iniae]ASL35360.1 trans-acting positive regulator [Streptococcus iniae]RLU31223.1 trans-acting positive regulator [Streptococcus iniae]RLU43690.1 trans-acting positive regulator [Streptococcus iniae]RLU46183.1 trans-acting positive regulator [Streptococcus iniae]RLU53130.1 trans-acting positive regulator [Streptococcus iniae]